RRITRLWLRSVNRVEVGVVTIQEIADKPILPVTEIAKSDRELIFKEQRVGPRIERVGPIGIAPGLSFEFVRERSSHHRKRAANQDRQKRIAAIAKRINGPERFIHRLEKVT